MFDRHQSVYTLLLWLAVSLFTVGCSGAGNEGSSQPDAAQSQTDPEVPTVTMPDQDAGPSDSSTTNEGVPE